jgi:hypothetical protein
MVRIVPSFDGTKKPYPTVTDKNIASNGTKGHQFPAFLFGPDFVLPVNCGRI